MKPFRLTFARWAAFVTLVTGALLVSAHAAVAATLQLERVIRTSPFKGTSVSMGDNEGSAFIPSDHSLWLADDNKKMIYEVRPRTGALKRTIARKAFNNARKLGGGRRAGEARTSDFEAIAYDAKNDVLYVFSGRCCNRSIRPTAFRLKRRSGRFMVQSYRPLARNADYTGAAWSRTDGKLYVGKGEDVRSFNYGSGAVGPAFSIGVGGITGMDFSSGGEDLFVTVNDEQLIRIDRPTRTVVSDWTFDLTPFGIRDSRAVAKIHKRLFVSDGASRARRERRRYAVFVFDVTG